MSYSDDDDDDDDGGDDDDDDDDDEGSKSSGTKPSVDFQLGELPTFWRSLLPPFAGSKSPRRTDFDSADGDSRGFRNASNYLPNDTALYIRGLEFSQNTPRNVGFPVEIRTGHTLHTSQSVTACVNIHYMLLEH